MIAFRRSASFSGVSAQAFPGDPDRYQAGGERRRVAVSVLLERLPRPVELVPVELHDHSLLAEQGVYLIARDTCVHLRSWQPELFGEGDEGVLELRAGRAWRRLDERLDAPRAGVARKPGCELGELLELQQALDSQLVDGAGQGFVGEPRSDVEERARGAGHPNPQMSPDICPVERSPVHPDPRPPARRLDDHFEGRPPAVVDAPKGRGASVAEYTVRPQASTAA